MTIPPRKLSSYFKQMQFPVEIFPEEGDESLCWITKTDLMQMIENEGVYGIGTWKKIKRLRLMKPISEAFAKVTVAGRITAQAEVVKIGASTWIHTLNMGMMGRRA